MAENSSDEFREPLCNLCSEKAASVFCPDCDNDLLCDSCESMHKKMRATRMHTTKHVSCYIDLAEYKPGRPTAISVTCESITINWSAPKRKAVGDYFQICYKDNTSIEWTTLDEEYKDSPQTLLNLKSGTEYVFRVRLIHENMDGPYSEDSECAKTVKSAASEIVEKYPHLGATDSMPNKYTLQLKEESRNEKEKIRAFELGSSNNGSWVEKTIMMVGETGTGKSTMIDGLANYILGVQWDDPFRVKLVSLESEEQANASSQAHSQTEWITRYTIHPFSGGRLKYSLNIIDTPGFGDTRGVTYDQKLVKQITKLFSSPPPDGVLHIDAICFLVRASANRLTQSQTYIINSIMSLFGKDIEQNICVFVTFADSKDLPEMAFLKASGMPCEQRFLFNNKALFTQTRTKDSFDPSFWEMGIDSFRKFFSCLESLRTQSLQLTKLVLHNRMCLENTVRCYEEKIRSAFMKENEIQSQIECLEKYKETIEMNKNYTLTTKKISYKLEALPKGRNVTNCKNCKTTCHDNCKGKKVAHKKNLQCNGKRKM